MNNLKKICAALLLSAVSAIAPAAMSNSIVMPEDKSFPFTIEVPVPVTATYVPKGFDSNDNSQVVVSGAYPNSCYKMGPTHVKVDSTNHRVTINVTAYFTQRDYCMMLHIPFTQTIDLGILAAANYELLVNRETNQVLPVALATRDQSDDFLYATVNHVLRVNKDNFELRGVLPNSCAQISEIRVIEEEGNVLTVLPIVRFIAGCQPRNDPDLLDFKMDFKVRSDLEGAKLIYVRSLNGASISQVFKF